MALGAVAMLLAGPSLGCFEPSLRDGQFACAADGTCPPGLQCSAGNVCLREPTVIIPSIDAGAPADAAPDDPLADRVAGAMVLYLFNEGEGSTVLDRSGVNPVINLQITVPPNVTWNDQAGTLKIDGTTNIVPPEPERQRLSGELRGLLQTSRELTVEVWITPDTAAKDGPRRIVALSGDSTAQSFVLGHGGSGLGNNQPVYGLRLRTSDVLAARGDPALESPNPSATTDLTHLVFTRNRAGLVRCYLDAQQRVTTIFDSEAMQTLEVDTRTGDFSVWEDDHILGLVNEADGDRLWTGTLHMVAIYARALSQAEVQQNFEVGADPEIAQSGAR